MGAVAAFLALSIAGIASEDPQTVRAAYLTMHLITWFVIVPFSGAALMTGLIQSLSTQWGVFRHYWVVAKLALTVVATLILLVHTQPIGEVSALASERVLTSSDLSELRVRLIADAGAALMALLVATTLSVYKPWGPTTYGRRAEHPAVPRNASFVTGSWWWLWAVGLFVAVAVFAYLHLAGGGMHTR